MVNFFLNVLSLLINTPLTAIRAGLLWVLVLFCLASPAAARLSGEVEWGYQNYSVKRDGKKVGDQSAFIQKYSVFHEKSGYVGDQRLGNYDLGLGYQWAAINSTINGDDNNVEQGKILYNGNVTIAPGGLPFRFNAYSYDTLAPNTLTRLPRFSILNRSIVYDLLNGQSSVSGINAVAGIRNGSYLGRYRGLLSKLPRIVFDYKQFYNRDVDGVTKNHNRTRDLAFVSLNKKDNWFHYRYRQYEDFMNHKNDESEKAYILGLIDHQMKRHWIRMTNWLDISVDGGFYDEDSAQYETINADQKLYALNLFAKANVNKIQMSSYGNYRRETNSDSITKDIELPFYANGSIDPNRSWAFQMQLSAHDEDAYSDESITEDIRRRSYDTFDEDIVYLRGSMTLGKQQAISYQPKLELELVRKELSNGFAARHEMEIVNNALFAGRQPFLLNYSATYVLNDVDSAFVAADGTKDDGDDTLELDVYGSTKWNLNPRNTFEATQAFRYNTGDSRFNTTRYITPAGSFLSGSYSNEPENSSESTYSSGTSFSLETFFQAGLRSRVNLENEATFGGPSGTLQATTLEHRLSYERPKWRSEVETRLIFGDNLRSSSLSISNGSVDSPTASATDPSDINYIIENSSRISYSPNRAFQSSVNFDYSWIDTDNDDAYRVSFEEESQYTFYSLLGRTRKIAEIYQEIEYEEYSSNNLTSSYLRMLAGFGYFPRSFFELGGELIYEAYDPIDLETLRGSIVASLLFSKLTCETRYSYGISNLKDASFDEQKEHLFEAKIKRVF